jgi:hypothetical protein
VFVSVDTNNTDTYLGSNVIIASPPEDPLVSVSLFSTGETFDRRVDAQDRIESYLAAGPEWGGFLLENHIAGQASIRLFQRPNTEVPPIGRTMILVYNEGLGDERLQYVRVTDVSIEEQTFTFLNNTSPEDYRAWVVTCDLSDALRLDFPGSPPSRYFSPSAGKTKVRDTVVANAARYYGVAPLTEAVEIGDVSCKVDTIFTQLVPSAQTEIPLIDQTGVGQFDTPIDAASGTVSYTTSTALGGGTAMSLGNSIVPETLVITHSGGELTDFGGQLYAGAEAIGTVDYARGTVTLISGAPTYSGSKTVTFRPAAAPLILGDTAGTGITAENRSFNYVKTIQPAPPPGTMIFSYRSNGRWYDLRDNGSGQLKGSDASFGVGTVSYSTGTVSVTLGALPDAGSSLLYAWGARPNYLNRSGNTVTAPRATFTLENGGVAPGSVTITWNDGSARTATDNGAGLITGDATGTIRYQTGEIELVPTALPLGGQEYTIEYGTGDADEEEFLNPPREGDNTIELDLGMTDITPGTVEVEWDLNPPDVENYAGMDFVFQTKKIARDDGAGAIKFGATTVGSINYTTGIITAFQPDMTVSVPRVMYFRQVRYTP